MIGAVLVPFPIRKYEKKFAKKYMEAILSNSSTRNLLLFEITKLAIAVFFRKFVASFIIIFRTLQWSFDLFQIRVLQRPVSSVSADAEDRYEMRLPASDGCRLRPMLRWNWTVQRHKIHCRNARTSKCGHFWQSRSSKGPGSFVGTIGPLHQSPVYPPW